MRRPAASLTYFWRIDTQNAHFKGFGYARRFDPDRIAINDMDNHAGLNTHRGFA